MGEEERQNTPEEAKFWSDKRILDDNPKIVGSISGKATAVAMGIDPDNYDEIVGKPKEEQDRIDFGKSYEDILDFLESYMEMPEEQKKVVAIWVLGTYLHDTFPSYPFLFINAMRGSGKTRLLKILSHLASNGSGMVSTEPTESVLYRTPKGHTMIFDEFEDIGRKEKNTFRQYLNASYKRGGVIQRTKKVTKKEGEGFEIETFEPYKPIAMANIWGMEEVLGDRCLSIILQKSNNPLKTKKIEDFEGNYTIEKLKRTLKGIRCSLCSVVTKKKILLNWNDYLTSYYTLNTFTTHTTLTTLNNNTNNKQGLQDELPEWIEKMYLKINNTDIDGRNLELIFPLLVTARLLNEETFLEILEILKKMIEGKKDEELSESKDVSVIDFVANNFNPDLSYHSISDLTKSFKAFLNETETDDDWLNSRWFGRALKRLDLILDKRRLGRGIEVSLNVPKAQEKLRMFKKEPKDI